MTAKRFNPGTALTVTVFIALTILIALGTWQGQKVGPKTALLERITVGLKAQPLSLPLHVDDPVSLEYRTVSFDGKLLAPKSARIFGLNLDGKPGYYIYAPVKRPHGMAVIVNFGWVPLDHDGPISLPEGVQRLNGVLLRSATAGTMTPENDAAAGVWYTADVHALAAYFGLRTKEYYHFRVFVGQNSGEPEGLLGGQVLVKIPNNHFQYMLTWYGLGLSLLGVYITFGFRQGRQQVQNCD